MSKLTPKQEAFARTYFETGNATEAYRKCYDVGEATLTKTISRKAFELLENGKVTAYVQELKDKANKHTVFTAQSLAQELWAIKASAVGDGQNSAAVSAVMGISKLFGLGVEKRQISGAIGVVSITPKQLEALNEDELSKLASAWPVLQKIGLVAVEDPERDPESGSQQED
jgi:phage terminase small subunit